MNVKCRVVLEDMQAGASIAANGVCLTAVKVGRDGFWGDLSPETLAHTNLGALREGSFVNLARPPAVADHLRRQIVQGHRDRSPECGSRNHPPAGKWWPK